MRAKLNARVEAERRPWPIAFTRVAWRSLAWRFRLARWFVQARIRRLRRRALALVLRQPAVARMRLFALRRRAERLNVPIAWATLGDLHRSYGDVEAALRAWKRGFELGPSAIERVDEYAYEQWQRGEWDEAHQAWESETEARRALAHRERLDRLPIRLLDRNWSGVIGAIALLDGYVKRRILAEEPLEQTVLLALPHTVSNPCYLEYWREHIPRIVDDEEGYERLAPLAYALRESVWMWPASEGKLQSYLAVGGDAQRRWQAEGRPPLLRLTLAHRERARARLAELGVPEDAWFVTLHVREAGYHDVRNADIGTYAKAVDAVVARGGWVVRIGDPTMTPLPKAERVVDYAHSDAKSDWMDVFLWSDCRFLIGTFSGPIQVPGTFGVPVVQTNWCPVGHRYWFSDDLQIPKLYRSEREHRLLSFPESIREPIGFAQQSEHLERIGIRLIDNTPEEIAEVVVEMLDRLDGTVVYTAEDEGLQARFDALEPPVRYRIPRGGARRGRDFLRRYAELLD